MSGAPTVSIVIATYNRREALAATLPSVLGQDFPRDGYEIVVVVDGSTDGTVEYLRSLEETARLRIVEQPNLGQFRALNRALDVARGEIVVFLDDDISCEPSLLREHVCEHERGGALLVFGPIFLDPRSPASLVTDWVAAYTDRWIAKAGKGVHAGSPPWIGVQANSSVRRATLLQCGGFDESFERTVGNVEFGLRLRKRGVEPRYRPRAVTHHLYVKPGEDLVYKDAESFGRNELRLCRKHPDYRPDSPLALLGDGSWFKRLMRSAAVRAPISPEPMLRLPFLSAERMRSIAPVRAIGIRLLEFRKSILMYRSALRTAGSWSALEAEFAARVPVLSYHHVGPPRPGTFQYLTVTPERFESQIRWLKGHGYIAIRPMDWLAWRREGKPLAKQPVVITFDDGYADIAQYALPVLEREGFGAAVYIVTARIGDTNRWDQAAGSAPHQLMDAEQIRFWAARGIEFGSHTRTHPDLTAITARQLEDELRGSAQDLQDLLGTRPVSIAYPYGRYSDAVRERTVRVFDIAYTCDEELNTLKSDASALGRAIVQSNDSVADLRWRLAIGFSPVPRIIDRLRTRVRLRTRLKTALRRMTETGA